MIPLGAWAGMRHLIQEPQIIIVESDEMDPQILHSLFGDKWLVSTMILDGADFGWFCRRRRLWGHCLHKMMVMAIYGSLDNVIPLFYR
eukprot:2957600-Karenia_brevis.AAC.1